MNDQFTRSALVTLVFVFVLLICTLWAYVYLLIDSEPVLDWLDSQVHALHSLPRVARGLLSPATEAYFAIAFAAFESLIAAGRPSHTSCQPTKHYTGWEDIKYAFIFYTSTGFNHDLAPPSRDNPLGNPPYPGATSSNGPNWVDFLTVKHNASFLRTYNLACGGATVDPELARPIFPVVVSLKAQVRDHFLPTYVPPGASKASPPWNGGNSVFAIWIGINDVVSTCLQGPQRTRPLNRRILAVYRGLVDLLYTSGARNFVFITVPSIERSPFILAQPKEVRGVMGRDLDNFNSLVHAMARQVKIDFEKGANVWVYDARVAFDEVLDDVASHEQTVTLKNTTDYCEAYQNGTPEPTTFYESCGVPVNEYFWLNGLHPTYPIHDVVANGISNALAEGPNVCPSPGEDDL